MDAKQTELLALAELRQQLTRISLELSTAATGAQQAAGHLETPGRAWVDVQQLLTRFEEATHRMGEFRRQVDDFVARQEQQHRGNDGAKVWQSARPDESRAPSPK
jgi:hypothetical protein